MNLVSTCKYLIEKQICNKNTFRFRSYISISTHKNKNKKRFSLRSTHYSGSVIPLKQTNQSEHVHIIVLFTPNRSSIDFFLDFNKAIKLNNIPKILLIPLFFFITITSINHTQKAHYHRPASQKFKILNRGLKI